MRRLQEHWVAGEVQCLNCGAVLAEVVRDTGQGTLALKPARFQSAVHVVVVERRLLRCQRCSGRALVELFADPREDRSVGAPGHLSGVV